MLGTVAGRYSLCLPGPWCCMRVCGELPLPLLPVGSVGDSTLVNPPRPVPTRPDPRWLELRLAGCPVVRDSQLIRPPTPGLWRL